jgi:hypothetical protein
VDATRGDDKNAGTEAAPWRTIGHALPKLQAGDTLYLRGGVFHENVYCAVAGLKDAPITIRSYPGEQAVLDGGLREFLEAPADAWVPEPKGGPGEFRSARPHKNIRDVIGLFGDSLIGLQTYWHAADLRAGNELWVDDPDKKQMVLPVYCGPGLWYDKQTGYIHVRLAHTHTKNPQVADYRGETDPRKLPLIISAFNSVPLFVDQAMHVRFQDLVIRGGGLNTVVLQFGVDLEFDNVTVFGGTYCLRCRSTGPLRMVNSALHGMIPPWAWRSENGLYTYTPREYDPFVPPDPKANVRNIARLPTHAVLVTEGSYEFEVFYYPHNHDWDIAHCEFTDGHDGVYLSGSNIRFHHNWVDNMQDDGIYLSSPTPYYSDQIRVYQNLITRVLSALSCHSYGGPGGNTFVYRNIVDLRQGVHFDRPSPKKPEGDIAAFHIFLTHGSDLLGIESLHFYQNTFISPAHSDGYAMRTWVSTSSRTTRRVFNNLFVYLNGYRGPDAARAPEHDIQIDGNLHWCPLPGAKPAADYLEKVRQCPASQKNKAKYSPGWEANSFVADPRFAAFNPSAAAKADYRLEKDSPAIGKGIVLPKDYEDPLRPPGNSRPDIGALPLGTEPPRFGRQGRVTLPVTGNGLVAAAPRAGEQAGAERLVLVRDGVANSVIVVGAQAPTPAYSALPAAQVLQRYLKKISGAEVPIMAEDNLKPEDARGKVLILVGDGKRVRSLGLSRDGLSPEGFLLKTAGGSLIILGGDDRTRQGSYFGALAFLERQLGVRWLMPFEVGEIVPKARTVALEPFEFRDQPKFAVRHIRNGYGNGTLFERLKPYLGDEKRFGELARQAGEWYGLQRLAFGVNINGGHSDEGFYQVHGKAHPEYLAQQPDGRRFVPERRAVYLKLCVSNPALIRQKVDDALAELKKNPGLDSVGISPNDGGDWGYCMCKDCKAWDDPRGDKFTFRPTYETPTFEYVSLSDRYARFYSEVAEQVCREHPKVLVVGMAYGHYTPAPLHTKVHPNVVIEFVGTAPWQFDRDRAADRKALLGWGKAGAQLAWRPNWMRQEGYPITYPHKLAEDLRAYYRLGMRYGDFDTCVNDWAAGGINFYVLARLLWDPEQDVDHLIDDYCVKGFGPAAPALKRYFARLEEASTQMAAGTDPKVNWYYEVARFWTPAFFRAAQADLQEADTLAGKSADAAMIRRRIDVFRQGLELAEIRMDMIRAVRALREKKGDHAVCEALVARRAQWYKDHLYTEALPVPYMRYYDNRFKGYFEP